ncbi:MAG: hypothetical protein U0441_20580 [Polyangiaceae bacterium]
MLRSLAVLDILLSSDWHRPRFSFVAKWGKHQLGTYSDFSGGWFMVLFTGPDAAVLKGYGHESAMTPLKRGNEKRWPGLFDGIPRDMVCVKNRPMYLPKEVTYCLWHPAGGTWTMGRVRFPAGEADPDGSAAHLAVLDEAPESYVRFVRDVHGKKVSLAAVKRVYAGEPLSWALISKLAPNVHLWRAVRDAEETGYPLTKPLLLKVGAEGW